MFPLYRATKFLFQPIVQATKVVKSCSVLYQKLQGHPASDLALRLIGCAGNISELSTIKLRNIRTPHEKGQLAEKRMKIAFFANLFFCFDLLRICQHLPSTFNPGIAYRAIHMANVFSLTGSIMFINLALEHPDPRPIHQNPNRLLDLCIYSSWIVSIALTIMAMNFPLLFQAIAINGARNFANAAIGFTITKKIYYVIDQREDLLNKICSFIEGLKDDWFDYCQTLEKDFKTTAFAKAVYLPAQKRPVFNFLMKV